MDTIINGKLKKKKYDWAYINDNDNIIIVNMSKVKSENDIKDFIYEYVYSDYEMFYIKNEKELFKLIYNLYNSEKKYRYYI